jgi:hypothetical protein
MTSNEETPAVSPVPPTAGVISKDALDELIDDLMSNQHGRAESTLKTWRLLLQHFRDSILSYAPPPCNLDGDGYLGAKYGYHMEQRVIRNVALREFRDALLDSLSLPVSEQ